MQENFDIYESVSSTAAASVSLSPGLTSDLKVHLRPRRKIKDFDLDHQGGGEGKPGT